MTPQGWVLLALSGLMIGSFLNVCIARIPAGESVVSPPSRCPRCQTPIRWHDNIPVLGFILLNARCRACKASISIRYPLVELVTCAAFVGQGMVVGDDWAWLGARLVFTALLIVLFGTDLDTQRLPNVLTFPGIAIGLLASTVAPPGLVNAVIGAALGAAILWLVRWGWYRATGVEGMGLGDVKMLAMIGAFLGWQQVWVTLFLASLAGAAIGVALMAAGARGMKTRLPFGTFLALAAYAASVVGEPLLTWYLALYQ